MINWGQVLSGVVIVGGVFVGASSQFTDMGVPPQIVKAIVAFSGLAVAIAGGFLTKFQSTANQAAHTADHIEDAGVRTAVVPAVASLRGVDLIQVNRNASPELAAMAASNAPGFEKINGAG